MKPILNLMAVAVAVLAPAFAHAETTLRVSNWLPPTHPIVTDIIEVWATDVERETEGRVKVEILPALGSPQAHFDLVRKGVADVAMGVDSYTADRFKLPYGVNVPFTSDDSTSASIAYWRIHQKYFAEYGEFDGVKLLGLWVHEPGYLHTTKVVPDSIEAIRNLKVRVAGGIMQDIAVALGLTPVFAPASETYQQLSSGVVDGVLFNMDSIGSFKLEGALHNVLMVPGGLYHGSHYMIMNQRKYDRLSEEDRAAIDKVSGEAIARLAGKAWDSSSARVTEALKAKGYNFVEPSPEFLAEIKELLAPIEQDWIARVADMGVDGEKVLADFRSEIEKVQGELDATQ